MDNRAARGAPSAWLSLGMCAAVVTAPCLWDSDTLADELRGLPDAHALLVGRWHRHSSAFYEDRVRRLKDVTAPSLAQLDDLAVAHERLGDRDAAIATMSRKREQLARTPDREHQYRYHANLGTFLAHAGDYAAALTELEVAIQIEPNAHFGRERFQIDAIRYIAAASQDHGLWTRDSFLTFAGYGSGGIYGLMMFSDLPADWLQKQVRPLPTDEAYQGIAGMLRFGGREGPELYRALALVFLSREKLNLAWWACQRAIERGHPARAGLERVIAQIEQHWEGANALNWSINPPPNLADFTAARANADAWLAAFQAAESAAIRRGESATEDAALAALLAAADRAVPPIDVSPGLLRWCVAYFISPFRGMATLVGIVVAAYLVIERRRRARAARTGGANSTVQPLA